MELPLSYKILKDFISWLLRRRSRAQQLKSEQANEERTKTHPSSVAKRFLKLFEAHGVVRAQIPAFFGHGLMLSDLENPKTILPKLNGTILDDACELFAVRREWIDGLSAEIFEIHDFYKAPKEFEVWLKKLLKDGQHPIRNCVVWRPHEIHSYGQFPAVLVFAQYLGNAGKQEICRYHLIGNLNYGYWKCRAYLAAIVAIATELDVHPRGRTAPLKWVEKYETGQYFSSELEGETSGQLWYPDALALSPEVFVEGLSEVDAKLDVSYWLDLQSEGFMEMPHDPVAPEEPRAAFEKYLEENA